MPDFEELEKTAETMDLTDPAEIIEDPIIEPVDIGEGEDFSEEEQTAETVDVKPEEASAEPEENGSDTPKEQATEPEVNGRLEDLERRINDLSPRLDSIAAALDKIIAFQESASAGPKGFFAPINDEREVREDVLPRIERKYI